MRNYTNEFKHRVIQEYIDGVSINQLAKKYHVSYQAVRQWVTNSGVESNLTERNYQKYEVIDDHALIYIKDHGHITCAVIDIDDIDKCKALGIWSITKAGYVVNRKLGRYLHRFLLDCPSGYEVDHRDNNPLNNRKSNLRIATSSQQKMNTRLRKDNKSGCRGVSFDVTRQKWQAHVKAGDKRIAKRFDKLEDAIAFVKKIRSELHGEFQNWQYQEANDATE